MIRQAVGAIVYKEDQFLLVHKVKASSEKIPGEWDFIKGGIEDSDESPRHAILRELKEETGSTDFLISKEFGEKICFTFPEKIKLKIGFERQETTMFLVEYKGVLEDLSQMDEEIAELQFLTKNEVSDKLTHDDTRSFFINHLSSLSTK
ncbi:NUDIX hydrolase [Fredinandcohnia sp. QZ13]|uniref:NUDIX hydrolase n=1 Tax=Fredinandcohnia sp. QZ13 TaxID=3073144 RepID=UPI0028532578|nr:NUDIX hydrolase [Fredinandcohnia sp. QZ13]MDR4889716.1 NUDIX hydrolase [Fredinandcohnia sp. QZ13]